MFHVKHRGHERPIYSTTTHTTERTSARRGRLLGRSRRRTALLWALAALTLVALGCTGERSPEGWHTPTASDDLVITQDRAGQLVALQFDGTAVLERWRYRGPDDEFDAVFADPLLDGRTLYIADNSGVVAAIDIRTGDPVAGWLDGVDLDATIVATPAIDDAGLLVVTDHGDLYRLSADGGAADDPFIKVGERVWSAPRIHGGNVIIATLDGHLRAYDLSSGALQWDRAIDGGAAGDGVIEGDTLYIGTLGERIVAIDLGADGAPLWEFEGAGWFWGTPQVTADRIFATTTSGMVYAIDRTNGALDWEFEGADGQFRGGAVLVGGAVIAATELGIVYALDQATGALLWEQELDGTHFLAAPLVRDGAVLLQSREGDLVRIQPDSGAAAVIHERG